jgi:hypothetical protein
MSNTEKYAAAEKEYTELKQHLKTSGQSDGRYEDSVGYMTINFHTTELFVQNKVFLPVPFDISTQEDFTNVFGDKAIPFCTIQGRYSHRKDIKIICPHATHGVYNIQAWTPLQANNVIGQGRGAMMSEASIEDGGSTALNLPVDEPDFFFCGRKYIEYMQSSCGWFSDLFVDVFLDAYCKDVDVKVWCSQESKTLPPAIINSDKDSTDGHLLIKVKAVSSADLSLTDGDPGAWFYIMGTGCSRRAFVFKLEEIGRKMQFHLVASSDSRYAFKTLEM